MILYDNITKTETNCNISGGTFTIKTSPLAFDILTSKLYANPKLAIVRELLCNAYDSQVAANTVDIPIHINLPDTLSNNLVIRDFGLGLNKEDVLNLYTTFFSSTKAESNDFTGCFGLGSKTPFSYTSAFSVVSYFNGIKYTFVAVKKDGFPSIYCTGETDTDELNGLEIIIPIKEEDKIIFKSLTNTYLSSVPEIKTNIDINYKTPDIVLDNIKLFENSVSTYILNNLENSNVFSTNDISIKQGQNVYTLTYSNIINLLYKIYDNKNSDKHTAATNAIRLYSTLYNIVIEIPIGTLEITPSRENLSENEDNTEKLKEMLNNLVSKLYTHTESFNKDTSSFYEKMTYLSLINKDNFNKNNNLYNFSNVFYVRFGCKDSVFRDFFNRTSNIHDDDSYKDDIKVAIKTSGLKSIFALNITDVSRVPKLQNCIISNRNDCLVVVMPYSSKIKKDIYVLYKTLLNYEEFNSKQIVVVYCKHNFKVYNRNSLALLHKIKKLDLGFNISITTFNKLINTYKDSSIPDSIKRLYSRQTIKATKQVEPNAGTYISVFSIHCSPISKSSVTGNFRKNTAGIESTKYLQSYCKDTTLVVTSNSIRKESIKINRYIKEMSIKHLRECLDSMMFKCDYGGNYRILIISSKYKKYFNDFITIDINDAVKELSDYCSRNMRFINTDNVSKGELHLLFSIDKIIDNIKPIRLKETIKATYVYKRLRLLSLIYKNSAICSNDNQYDSGIYNRNNNTTVMLRKLLPIGLCELTQKYKLEYKVNCDVLKLDKSFKIDFIKLFLRRSK